MHNGPFWGSYDPNCQTRPCGKNPNVLGRRSGITIRIVPPTPPHPPTKPSQMFEIAKFCSEFCSGPKFFPDPNFFQDQNFFPDPIFFGTKFILRPKFLPQTPTQSQPNPNLTYSWTRVWLCKPSLFFLPVVPKISLRSLTFNFGKDWVRIDWKIHEGPSGVVFFCL